jgi:lipopolysaccharide export system permease protein
MTLTLYIARRYVQSFGLVFGVVALILFLVETIEQIRRFGNQGVGVYGAAELALLNLPGSVYTILPLITILATVAFCLSLARSSELVVTRAAGRSALATLVAPVTATLLIGGLAVGLLNPIVAATSKQFEAKTRQYQMGEASVLSVSREGIWLRQGGADGQTVIRADRSNLDATELFGVTFITFAAGGGPVARIEAESARLTPGAWVLTGAKSWRFDAGGNPELDAVTAETLPVPSDLTADSIRDSFGTPRAVPFWELRGFIDGLQRAGYSARKHLVWFQMELALPLLLAAMVLVGAGFTMRHARFGRTGQLVLAALAFGFATFFVRNFAQVLGENGQIPVLVAAWAPPVAALLFSLGLLLHLEDG